MTDIRRRDLLVGTAFALLSRAAGADVIQGALPWQPNAAAPPLPFEPGGWRFFTAAEGATVEAIADCIIPPDPGKPGTPIDHPGTHAPGVAQTQPAQGAHGTEGETPDLRTEWCPGGKDAGCAVFLDRQLAGPFGRAEGLYMKGPFEKGSPQQGDQSPHTPSQQWRSFLAALDTYCRGLQDGKPFVEMTAERQNTILSGLESGTVKLENFDGHGFFKHITKDLQEGFFADPIYGGNRNMCAWKMIGFPGAHYDYRDWIDRHNERYPRPPVSIGGRPGWITRT
jgi:gluconate 2-dehydrogenase gamma chain